MIVRRPRRPAPTRTRASGFSMIEVLVSLLVLALGLLGFALLQTMNLRYTQSADYRTHATNLAYDLLDQMRANRHSAVDYSGSTGASFDVGEVTNTVCSRPTGTDADIAGNIARWQCQVVRTLGPTASAGVDYVSNGDVTITIAWGDQRWDQADPEATTTFEVETRL